MVWWQGYRRRLNCFYSFIAGEFRRSRQLGQTTKLVVAVRRDRWTVELFVVLALCASFRFSSHHSGLQFKCHCHDVCEVECAVRSTTANVGDLRSCRLWRLRCREMKVLCFIGPHFITIVTQNTQLINQLIFVYQKLNKPFQAFAIH